MTEQRHDEPSLVPESHRDSFLKEIRSVGEKLKLSKNFLTKNNGELILGVAAQDLHTRPGYRLVVNKAEDLVSHKEGIRIIENFDGGTRLMAFYERPQDINGFTYNKVLDFSSGEGRYLVYIGDGKDTGRVDIHFNITEKASIK